MNIDSRILITGASGMVGSCLVNKLQELGYKNLLTPTSKELNLFLDLRIPKCKIY